MTTNPKEDQAGTEQSGPKDILGNNPRDDQCQSLGQRLQAARGARGWSLEEVAAATRIKTSTLNALEEGNFRALPAASFARGFVRVYAAHLGLNPDDALRLHLAERGLSDSVVTKKINLYENLKSGGMAEAARGLTFWRVLGLLFILALVFFAYWSYQHFRSPPVPTSTSTILLNDQARESPTVMPPLLVYPLAQLKRYRLPAASSVCQASRVC